MPSSHKDHPGTVLPLPPRARRAGALCAPRAARGHALSHSCTGSFGKSRMPLRAQLRLSNMSIPLTWSFSQSWLRMLLSMAYFTKRMSRLSMRKLRSPNQNTRLWVGRRATGWKGRGYRSQAVPQGEDILSLWAASACSTGALGSTSAGQHSANHVASCQPCQDSSGRTKHH